VLGRLRASLVLTLGLAGCTDWQEAVVPGVANLAPTQVLIERPRSRPLPGAPGVTLTPRARYTNRAWAVAVDRPDDDWSDAIPLDVALAWGPVGSPAILRHVRFHLKRRYVSARWRTRLPLGEREVMRHLSNHHLIPAAEAVRESLEMIRPGDLVTLEGELVDVTGPAGRFATSLSREDIGNGACEVVFVEKVEVARP